MRILKNGFYINNSPKKFIDTFSGGFTETNLYECILFTDEYYFAFEKISNLNFNFYLRGINAINDYKKDNSNLNPVKVGKYFFDNKQVFTEYFLSNQIYKSTYSYLTPDIILDEQLNEYHFKYVVGIEYEEKYFKEIINRGDDIWTASNPMELNLLFKDLSLVPVDALKTPEALANYLKTLSDPAILNQITGFGREVQVLSKNGYVYNNSTKIFIK
ncbi:MAG: hypothetical protein HXX16_09195 [Bacteroidales bacterium]|nr:hypothetical protein [Bacteroidales bacterium]